MAIITKIEAQKKHEDRVNLYLDGQFFMGTYKEVVYKLSLKKEGVIDKEQLEVILKEENLIKAKKKAYDILNRSMQSEEQLRRKLMERDFEEDIIDGVIDSLKEYNYIDDELLAKTIVRDKKNIKRFGKRRIEQNLYQKKIDRDIIKQALDEELNKEEEYENALYLAQKRVTRIKDTDNRKVYTKLARHLAYKGFDYDVIKRVIKEVMN